MRLADLGDETVNRVRVVFQPRFDQWYSTTYGLTVCERSRDLAKIA